MKKLMVVVFVAGLSFTYLYAAAKGGFRPTVVAVEGNLVTLTTAMGKRQTIHASHEVATDDISLEDLDFDGNIDVRIFKSSGNAQKFYDIYLYNSISKKYELNKQFSDIPCIGVDIPNHQVVGACFHASACENWTEHYLIDRSKRLHLVSREGTYCDPATGNGFSYVDRFKDGQRIYSHSESLKTKGSNE